MYFWLHWKSLCVVIFTYINTCYSHCFALQMLVVYMNRENVALFLPHHWLSKHCQVLFFIKWKTAWKKDESIMHWVRAGHSLSSMCVYGFMSHYTHQGSGSDTLQFDTSKPWSCWNYRKVDDFLSEALWVFLLSPTKFLSSWDFFLKNAFV